MKNEKFTVRLFLNDFHQNNPVAFEVVIAVVWLATCIEFFYQIIDNY